MAAARESCSASGQSQQSNTGVGPVRAEALDVLRFPVGAFEVAPRLSPTDLGRDAACRGD